MIQKTSEHTPPGHSGEGPSSQPPPQPTPPTQFSVYSFSVYLKSKLAAGGHLGETVAVIAASAQDAQQAVSDNFGDDLVQAVGSTTVFDNAYMAASTTGKGKGFLNINPPNRTLPPEPDSHSSAEHQSAQHATHKK